MYASRHSLSSFVGSLPIASDWSLATFPADDAAGRHALRLARYWLAASYGIVANDDGSLIASSEDTEDAFYEKGEEILGPDRSIDDSEPPSNVFLHGPIGSGKTGLAWSLLRLVHEHEDGDGGETELRFANVVALIRQAKRAMNDPEVEDPFPALLTPDLIVVDDLGAERVTSWARSSILELVQHRYDHGRPTIVTSNYTPSALAMRLGQATRDEPTAEPLLGQRIVSRLIHGATRVHLDRHDLRAANTLRVVKASESRAGIA